MFPVIPFFGFLAFQLNRMAEILLLFLISLSFILILIFQPKKHLLLFSIPALLFVLEDAKLAALVLYSLLTITLVTFEKIGQRIDIRFILGTDYPNGVLFSRISEKTNQPQYC